MGLITCLDCNSEISDAAVACPKCGRPTNPALNVTNAKEKSLIPMPGLILVVVGVIVFLMGSEVESGGFWVSLAGLLTAISGLTISISHLVRRS